MRQTEGPVLLLAVPGSGKTTVLITRAGYLNLAHGVPSTNILCLTYTKAAALEMKERYCKKFRIDQRDAPYFSTINAFCNQVLITCSREKGERLPKILENSDRLLRTLLKKQIGEYPSDADVKLAQALIGKAKNEMLNDDQIAELSLEQTFDFPVLYDSYRKALRENNGMDFDDQMVLAMEYLNRYPDLLERIRKRYQYLALDEAQDTSLIQHKIVQLITGRRGNLFMVGDEDQSIYGFRGASPRCILSFQQDYDNATVLRMETNYRSDILICKKASLFIKRNHARMDKTILPWSQEDGKLVWKSLPDETMQADYLMSLIRKYEGSEDTLAILFRNNESAIPLLAKLVQEPHHVRFRGDVKTTLANYIISDILNLLRFAKAGSDESLFRQLYFKMNLFLPKVKLDLFLQTRWNHRDPILHEIASSMDHFLTDQQKDAAFSANHVLQKIAEMPPEPAIQSLLHDLGYKDYVAKKIKASRSSQSTAQAKINTLLLLARECTTIQDLIDQVDKLSSFQGSENSNITLSTMHSSKGLEFDRVELINLHNGVLPSDSPELTWEDREEEVRLFYVAATRARHHLEIITPSTILGEPVAKSPFVDAFFGNDGWTVADDEAVEVDAKYRPDHVPACPAELEISDQPQASSIRHKGRTPAIPAPLTLRPVVTPQAPASERDGTAEDFFAAMHPAPCAPREKTAPRKGFFSGIISHIEDPF